MRMAITEEMKTRRDRKFMKAPLRLLLCAFACLLSLTRLSAAEEESDKAVHPLDGSWRWTFTMPDGSTSRPKLVLEIKQGKLMLRDLGSGSTREWLPPLRISISATQLSINRKTYPTKVFHRVAQ